MGSLETAYFAGGCFWCITPTFRQMPGVLQVVSGYSGGDEAAPSYDAVKSQKTSHRETIRIDFDAEAVSYSQLLEVYLSSVDPFDAGGQFIDRGHSYTLAVYYCSAQQQHIAAEQIRQLAEEAGKPACIALEPFKAFYPAEEYHQNYDLKHPEEFHQELIQSGRIRE